MRIYLRLSATEEETPQNGNIDSNKRSLNGLSGLSGLFLSPGESSRVSAFVFDK